MFSKGMGIAAPQVGTSRAADSAGVLTTDRLPRVWLAAGQALTNGFGIGNRDGVVPHHE